MRPCCPPTENFIHSVLSVCALSSLLCFFCCLHSFFITPSLFLHFLMVRIIGNRWAFRLLWQQRAPAPASLPVFQAVKCRWPLGEQRKSMSLINTAIKSAGVCMCVCVCSSRNEVKKKTLQKYSWQSAGLRGLLRSFQQTKLVSGKE